MLQGGKILQGGAGHLWRYGARAMHAEYLTLQIQAQVV
jgi:hypothetical protein